MWILKLIFIILWLSLWGILDVILQKYNKKTMVSVIYIFGISLTSCIITRVVDNYKNKN